MARKPKPDDEDVLPFDVGDWLWVLTKVTKVHQNAKFDLDGVTVEMSNGHKETIRYNTDEMQKAES